MPFKKISRKSFAPMFRGPSLMAGIGAIAIVLALNAAISSPAAMILSLLLERPSSARSATLPAPTTLPAPPARWTAWRLGSEDGTYYIEYNWQPRNKAPIVR